MLGGLQIVLLVEDETLVRMVAADQLEMASFRVLEAESADAPFRYSKLAPTRWACSSWTSRCRVRLTPRARAEGQRVVVAHSALTMFWAFP
jgi:hypothetical protein